MKPPIEVNNVRSQLSYLTDTKEIIKQALLNKGANITDETTFRNYASEIDKLGQAKVFATFEDMEQDQDANEGALSVVYGGDLKNITPDMTNIPGGIWLSKSMFLPNTNMYKFITNNFEMRNAEGIQIYKNNVSKFYLRDENNSSNDITCQYSFSRGNFSNSYILYASAIYKGVNYAYTGSDVNNGILLTRNYRPELLGAYQLPDTQNLDFTLEFSYDNNGNIATLDSLYNLIPYGDLMFGGVYKYANDKWSLAPTQFTAVDRDVMNVIYYGADGISNGNLNTSKYFTDENIGDLSDYCNKYSSLFSSLKTTHITNFNYFGKNIPDSLVSVNFVNVTNNAKDCTAMFRGKSNIYVISNTTNWDVSNVTNMTEMFMYCRNLTHLSVNNWNTSNVTNMANMFMGCNSLKFVNGLHTWDVSNVTNMVNMFRDCDVLNSDLYYQYRLGNWKPSNVVDMTDMFRNCQHINEVTMSSWDVSNVKYTRGMYRECTSLHNIGGSLPTFENVVSANGMFAGCINLYYCNIKTNYHNTFANCEDFSNMFTNCYRLSNINGSGINITSAKNTDYMFYNCTNATYLNLCGTANNLISMNYMFGAWYGDKGVKINTIPEVLKNTPNLVNARGAYYKSNLVEAPINWNMPKLKDAVNMFADCPYLVELNLNNCNLPNLNTFIGIANCNNLQHLKVYNGKMPLITTLNLVNLPNLNNINISRAVFNNITSIAFNNLPNLTVLNLSNIVAPNLQNLSYLAYNARKLKTVNLSNLSTSNLTNISYLFYNCSNLTNMNLTSWNVSNVTSATSLFSGCTNLTDANISGWNLDKLSSLTTLFGNCYNLTNLDVFNISAVNATTLQPIVTNSSKLTILNMTNWNIPNLTTLSFGYMLNGCPLTELNLANWDVSNVKTTFNLFRGCTSLKTLNAHNWNTSSITTLAYAFDGCTNLTNLDITGWNLDNVTNLSYAFRNSNMNYEPFTAYTFDKLQNMSLIFNGCTYDGDLPLFNWNTSQINTMHYLFAESHFTNIDISTWNLCNVKSFEYMFMNCDKVQTITINDQPLVLLNSLYAMFSGCTNLQHVNFNFAQVPNATNVASLFSMCNNLMNIDINNWHAPNLNSISYMFNNDKNLTDVNISNCTWNIPQFYNMFRYCYSLTNLNMTDMNLPNLKNTPNSLCYGTNHLTNINLHNWYMPNCTELKWMFSSSSGHNYVDISNWYAPKLTTFENMNLIRSGVIDTNLAYGQFDSITDISNLFNNRSGMININLYGVNLPNVTSLTNMFNNSRDIVELNLDNIHLPNVTTADRMFMYCRSLSVNSEHSIVNMCLNLNNLTTKIFNYANSKSLIYATDINIYNIGGVDRSQELLDAGWTL